WRHCAGSPGMTATPPASVIAIPSREPGPPSRHGTAPSEDASTRWPTATLRERSSGLRCFPRPRSLHSTPARLLVLLGVTPLEGDPFVLVCRDLVPPAGRMRPSIPEIAQNVAASLVDDLLEGVDVDPVVLVHLPPGDPLPEVGRIRHVLRVDPRDLDHDLVD